METREVQITAVVQGKAIDIGADPSESTGDAVRLALERPGIGGATGEWTARTMETRVLDNSKSLIEEGIRGPTELYIRKGSGRGVGGTGMLADMAGDTERRNVEFKEGRAWKGLGCVPTRTVMAMANLQGGGTIVAGVREGHDKLPDPMGMGRDDFDSCNSDDVTSFVNEYAEPSVAITMHKVTEHEKHYVVFYVDEFGEVPIVCKKDGRKSCRDRLRRGSVYHRPRRKVECTDRFDYADMRELVDFAAAKQHRSTHLRCAGMYGTGGGGGGAPPSRALGADSTDAKYSREGGGF